MQSLVSPLARLVSSAVMPLLLAVSFLLALPINSNAQTIGLSVDPNSIRENGGTTLIRVTASVIGGSLATDLTVAVTVGASGDTATGGTDYYMVTSPPKITIKAGARKKTSTFYLTPIEDSINEGAGETLSVNGATTQSGVTVNGTSVTIIDNDGEPTSIDLSVDTNSVSEGDSQTEIKVTASVIGGSLPSDTTIITVTVGASGDTATEGTDYATVSTFNIPIRLGGTSSGTSAFYLTPIKDADVEGDEVLSVNGTTSIGVTVNGTSVTITDDDRPRELSIQPVTVLEGEMARFTVTLSGRVASEVTVDWATEDGAAEAPDDYTASSGTVTFISDTDVLTQAITVPTRPDAVVEGDETFLVRLSNVGGPLGVSLAPAGSSAAGTITDEAEASARVNHVNEEVLSNVAQAMAASMLTAITGRIDAAAPGTSSLTGKPPALDSLQSNGEALEDGTLSLVQVLGGSSFVLPLNAAENDNSGGAGGLAVWGSGDYRELSGTEDGAVEWEGDMFSVHLGADMRVWSDFLVGLSISRSQGSFDYTDRTDHVTAGGRYESRMNSVHPYVSWSFQEGMGLWASAGYGRGEIEITDDISGRDSSDAMMVMAALGASGKLVSDDKVLAGGTTTLRLKGESSIARIEVEGAERINPLTSDVRLLRLSLEGSHEREFASGGRLTPSVEVGVRHDGGGAMTGAGLELGAGLHHANPAMGLALEGRGRALFAHEDGYEDWGIGGLVRLDPWPSGRGLSLSITPVIGVAESGVDRLYERGLFDMKANGDATSGRLNAELGYGLSRLGGRGLVTPFAGLLLADGGGRRYSLGGRFAVGQSLNLSLEAERRESDSVSPDHGVMLSGQLCW